jgi:hypothetical protein
VVEFICRNRDKKIAKLLNGALPSLKHRRCGVEQNKARFTSPRRLALEGQAASQALFTVPCPLQRENRFAKKSLSPAPFSTHLLPGAAGFNGFFYC